MMDGVTFGDLSRSAKSVATLIGSLGVILSALAYATWNWGILPQLQPLIRQVERLAGDVEAMRLAVEEQRDFMEFIGSGIVPEDRIYRPGEVVTVFYMLRQSRSCNARVQVRFMTPSGQFATDMTYEIPATSAPSHTSVEPFRVDVKIPPQTRSGRYAYLPVIFSEYGTIPAPISDFFRVERRTGQ